MDFVGGAAVSVTGIPVRALRSVQPGQSLWSAQDEQSVPNTFAAIGKIGFNRKAIFAETIVADDNTTPAIYGVSLTGKAAASIPDTETGVINGDATIDRVVRPMRLIAQTW